MSRNSSMKYVGTKQYVDTSTGEIKDVDCFEKLVGRNEPFMITYMNEIVNLFDVLGNKKMQIVKYIIKKMNKSNNVLMITTEQLAMETKTSRQTVSETLKLLANAGIIHRRVGAIMINPKLINNKSAAKERQMLIKFQDFEN